MSYTHSRLKQRLYYTYVVQSPDYSFMETNSLPRHRLIENQIAQPTVDAADAVIHLWEQMAIEIASIIGEGGFNSLYARSVFLSQSRFPRLVLSASPLQANQRFADLKKSFEGQSSAEIITVHNFLLRNFTDTLATLIGEELTSNILRSAWGNPASNQPGKESDHE